MSQERAGPDRDMCEIAQSIEFTAEDCAELSEALQDKTRNDYLEVELMKLKAIKRKITFNVERLEAITGQQTPYVADIPF